MKKLEKMEHWTVQVIVPEGTYSGADEMIEELTQLVEFNSEIEVISVELTQPEEVIPDANQK